MWLARAPIRSRYSVPAMPWPTQATGQGRSSVVAACSLSRACSPVAGPARSVRSRSASAVGVMMPAHIGLGARGQRGQPHSGRHDLLPLLLVAPPCPALEPLVVVFGAVEVDVETPVHSLDPFELEHVDLRDGDAADLSPGLVPKGVVV